MLKLPSVELQILYTKHIILKELLIKDVSLYILSVSFLYRKQLAFDFYDLDETDKALPLLESLEDRFINGVVSYRIGYCSDNHDFYSNAYHLFKNKDLSPEELYYMGVLHQYGRGTTKNNGKAIEYYKLSNYPKAYVNLGCAYRDSKLGFTRDYVTAVMYFEKALNHPDGQCHLIKMISVVKNFI